MGLSTSPEKGTQKNESEKTSKTNEKKKRIKNKTDKKPSKYFEKQKKDINSLIGENLISTYQPMPPYPYWQPCFPPIPVCKWGPYIHFNLHTFQLPLIVNPNQFLAPIHTFPGMVPLLSPLIPFTNENKVPSRYEPLVSQPVTPEEYVINEVNETCDEVISIDDDGLNNVANETDPIEAYLKLPKNLFPKARSLKINPNPIIDEFCKLPDVFQHAPWILDLEFGIPRSPITRTIPFYNVKMNSIHCKNTPEAIHPGFESCTKDFKDIFLFYYDSVISTWYTGYVIWNNDNSIDNFQSWLMMPVQLLGMCWS